MLKLIFLVCLIVLFLTSLTVQINILESIGRFTCSEGLFLLLMLAGQTVRRCGRDGRLELQ